MRKRWLAALPLLGAALVFGIFAATDLVPVPQQTLLRLELTAAAAAMPGGLHLGARTWQILNATRP